MNTNILNAKPWRKNTVLPVNEVCKLMSCCSQKGHGVNAINVVLAEVH